MMNCVCWIGVVWKEAIVARIKVLSLIVFEWLRKPWVTLEALLSQVLSSMKQELQPLNREASMLLILLY